MALQEPVNAGFGYKVALLIGERHRQFSRAQLAAFQRHVQDIVLHLLRDPVPCPARSRPPVFQCLFAETALAQIIPAVEGRQGDAERVQRLLGGQMAFFEGS